MTNSENHSQAKHCFFLPPPPEKKKKKKKKKKNCVHWTQNLNLVLFDYT